MRPLTRPFFGRAERTEVEQPVGGAVDLLIERCQPPQVGVMDKYAGKPLAGGGRQGSSCRSERVAFLPKRVPRKTSRRGCSVSPMGPQPAGRFSWALGEELELLLGVGWLSRDVRSFDQFSLQFE